MPRLVAEAVTKTYALNGTPLRAVDGVSIAIEPGEFVSIIGHSGSGKTTLLSMLGGLSNPTSGRVLFGDDDVYASGPDELSRYRCRQVGFVFQFASLLPALTAKENVLLPTGFRDARPPAAEAEARAIELLARVGMSDKVDAYPAQLSGGQQRRVAIARAFVNAPAVILADEPTGDLDEETEAEVMKVFRAMNERSGTSVVLVTHDTDLARQAGRRLRMHQGVITEL